MKKGIISKLKSLVPKKNIAFSWCSCNNPSHSIHSQALKKSNKDLVKA
ncbi:hypothetical protein [Acetivibrio ethanolgignens]|nr:hypothetical protein [Acetivibrio ethanolgignens]